MNNDSVVPMSAALTRKILKAYALSTEAANAAEAHCTQVVEAQIRGWQSFFVHAVGKGGPDDAASPQEFDGPTQQAFRTAGVDLVRLKGNGRAYWGEGGEIIKTRDRIIHGVAKACGHTPTEEQLGAAKYATLGYLVRLMFDFHRGQNVGAVVLKGKFDTEGRPLLLVRTQCMADAAEHGSFYRTALELGVVKHVCNLYAGHFPLEDWLEAEAKVCADMRDASSSALPSYFDERARKMTRKWRRMVDDADEWTEANKRNAMMLCASQIKDLLNPNGEPPKGGILIHCAGGMHRTGMIYGIIRRYVNDDPIDEIVADYKRHVDWKAEGAVGGYEELNVRFIKEFDLSLLDAQEIVFEEGMTQDEPISAAGGTRDEWRYA